MTGPPEMSITEKNISAIHINRFRSIAEPLGGEAKWFRDELGQLWCKWLQGDPDDPSWRCVKADLILEVHYLKRSDPRYVPPSEHTKPPRPPVPLEPGP